ncbi:hypothetical protein BUALT_Bualt19G0000800 [Buddleja alternifolia]|uniref:Uncharacterized protein n=1 Tax=Buddleja alternifolia TaxID=168488 RepID=A0AAV6W852_9LAMI|nr:hypothetical protein BUALT_Bualt19G0000800 [Buddleja alternifolia]
MAATLTTTTATLLKLPNPNLKNLVPPPKQPPQILSKLLLPTPIPLNPLKKSQLNHHHHHDSSHNNNNGPPPPQKDNNDSSLFVHLKSAASLTALITLPFFLEPQDAVAVGGQFGILEGRSFALIHPIVMSGLFVYTLYAGYLGWQWRRVRTTQDEINELKKQVKPPPAAAVAVTPDGTPAPAAPQPPNPSSPLEAKIQQLTQERKELIKGAYRDKHFNAGSILLGFGVLESVFGGINTWLRTGKLFPGPHLFAGAAITVLWAAAAALVPPMQKGNETARNLHIALNGLNVLLFIWQIPTGIDIVFKVFEFTKWP